MRHRRLSVISMIRAAAFTGISQTRVSAVCSNSRVKALPLRVQGTSISLTPCSGCFTRGAETCPWPWCWKKIQVPPGLLEVMRGAGLAADRTGMLRPAIRLDRRPVASTASLPPTISMAVWGTMSPPIPSRCLRKATQPEASRPKRHKSLRTPGVGLLHWARCPGRNAGGA